MLGIFLISMAMTAYSFYNLANAVRFIMGDDGKPIDYMKTEQLKERVLGQFVPDHVRVAVDALVYLQNLGEKLQTVKIKTTDPDADFSKLNQQEIAQLREKIIAFNNLQWEELSLFAASQIDPFSREPEMVSLRKIRYAARLMSAYLDHFKRENPEENSTFIFSAILKLASFTETTNPYLIGKMVAIAINGTALKPFSRSLKGNGDIIDLPKESILDLNLISPQEADELHQALMTSLKLEVPFKRFLESEYAFFKHFSAKIYEKAPLAAFILNTIFGNPDNEYREIINHPEDKELLMKTLQGWKHPALVIAVPNFTRACEVFHERRAKRAVLAAELAHIAAKADKVPDPFAQGSVLSLESEGKLKFYSVGLNGIDDKMQGDDISLYCPVTDSEASGKASNSGG